ncbi:hypothetical protein E2562_006711, partial [Oryza meyeriana var. granulata]
TSAIVSSSDSCSKQKNLLILSETNRLRRSRVRGLTRAGSCANHKLPLCRVEEGCHQSTRSVSSVPDHMQDATAGS